MIAVNNITFNQIVCQYSTGVDYKMTTEDAAGHPAGNCLLRYAMI